MICNNQKFETGSLVVVNIPCSDNGVEYMIGDIGLVIDYCFLKDFVTVLIKGKAVTFTPKFLETL